MYQLFAFDTGSYKRFEDAEAANAVFNTLSTIDAICIDGPNTPLLDLIEVVDMIRLAAGSDNLVYGIIHRGKFVDLKLIESALDSEECLTEPLLDALAQNQNVL